MNGIRARHRRVEIMKIGGGQIMEKKLQFLHLGTHGNHGYDRPKKGYDKLSDYIFNFNGTSSATPLVAGSIALMLAVNPKLTLDEIIAILKNNSDDLGEIDFDERFGYGRLNVEKLLIAAEKIKNDPWRLSTCLLLGHCHYLDHKGFKENPKGP